MSMVQGKVEMKPEMPVNDRTAISIGQANIS